jgi:hypothetical protein
VKRYFLLLLFCSISFFINGQQLYSEELHAVNSYLYKFNFTSADTLLSRLEKQNSPDPEVRLARANFYWWNIISGNNSKQIMDGYNAELEKCLQLASKYTAHENKRLMLLINIYSFKARINGLNKNYIKAFQNINNCISHLKTSFGREQSFEFFYLTSGLYNYYISQAHTDYPVLVPYLILIPGGNKEKGLQYLNRSTVAADPDQRTEANYFLMKINLEQKKYSESLTFVNKLLKDFPDNLLYRYYRFKLLLSLNQKDKALAELTQIRISAFSNATLNSIQRDHFLNLAQKELAKYYREK